MERFGSRRGRPAYDRTMRWWVVAAGVLALASCSDGDGETAVVQAGTAPPTVPDSAPAPSATTTSPAPATEPSTTSTTTTSPPTTTTPPTTVDPAIALAEQVEADFREAERLRIRAARDPKDSVKRSAALDARIGQNRDLLRTTLDDLARDNLAVRPSDYYTASNTIEVGPTFTAADEAVIQRCEIDPWVVVEVGGAPDGSDAVIDDNVYAYRNRVTLRLVDNKWRIESGLQLGRWAGSTECPADS